MHTLLVELCTPDGHVVIAIGDKCDGFAVL